MPYVIAKEHTEQYPRAIVGARIVVFQMEDNEVTTRADGVLVTASPTSGEEIEFEYDLVEDLLEDVGKHVDTDMVEPILRGRKLPHLSVEVFCYKDKYGLAIRAMSIGNCVAAIVASCLVAGDADDAEGDDDGEIGVPESEEDSAV